MKLPAALSPVRISVAGLGLLSFFIHVLPFFLFGAHPLGYDTGFYRRYLLEPLYSFPNTPVPGLGDDAFIPRLLLDTLRFLELPPDIILYGSYIVCATLLPILLFLYLRPLLGIRGALVGGVCMALSAVSYNAYWYMLWKNAFALDLLLLGFILLERRSLWPLFVLDILIALSHKTTTLMYAFSLGIVFLLSRGKRFEVLPHICLVTIVFLLVNLPTVREVGAVLPSAVFLDWQTYLVLSAPLLVLLIAGARGIFVIKIPITLAAFSVAGFLFPLLHLPFYERIFVFCDVALAALAACSVEYLIRSATESSRRLYVTAIILCVAGGSLLGTLWNQVAMLKPLVEVKTIQEIQTVATLLPKEAYLLTTSDEAPYFEGWTRAHIIAPGLLWDTHNFEEWEKFWSATSTNEKIEFLDSFPTPLYISTFTGIEEFLGELPECVIEVAPHLFKKGCD